LCTSHATHCGEGSFHIARLDVISKLAVVKKNGLIEKWVKPKTQGPLQQLYCFCQIKLLQIDVPVDPARAMLGAQATRIADGISLSLTTSASMEGKLTMMSSCFAAISRLTSCMLPGQSGRQAGRQAGRPPPS